MLRPHPGRNPGAISDRETAKTTRTRFGSRLAMLMLLLFGTGYLIVDVYMSNRPASSGGQPTASRAELQSATEAANLKLDTGTATPQAAPEVKRSQLTAPADAEQNRPDIVPPPRRPQHVPETVTDDLSQVEPEAGWRSSSLDAPAQGAAPAAAATTVALPRGAAAEPMEKARTLSGRGLVILPTTIGPAALRHAAASGDPDAAFEVASRYAEGKGVTQDLKEAFAWYQRAAAQGHASAQFRVAAFHERGVGVATDRERAILWYRRAAEQGHVKAMHNLAVLLAGKGADRADYERRHAGSARRPSAGSPTASTISRLCTRTAAASPRAWPMPTSGSPWPRAAATRARSSAWRSSSRASTRASWRPPSRAWRAGTCATPRYWSTPGGARRDPRSGSARSRRP